MIDEIFKSLDNWGEHPAFIEVKPDKPAVYTSAEQFKERILKTAEFLKQSGLGNNFFGIMFLENSVDFVSVFFGLMHIGAKPIPSKLEYRKIELDEIFVNSDPQAIICEEHHLDILKPYIKDRIVITRKDGKLDLHQTPKKKLTPKDDVPEDIASINYTYRGYGYPLGAMAPYSQYSMGAKVFNDYVKMEAKNNMLVIIPYPHMFSLVACVVLPLIYKITSTLLSSAFPKTIFDVIKTHKINYFLCIPEIFLLLSRAKNKSITLPSLKLMISGGSNLTAKAYRKIQDAFGVELLNGYGLTEFVPVSGHKRNESKAGTIGPLCLNIVHKIDCTSSNASGELLIDSPHMTRKYYKRPKETAEAFDGKWFKTGDMCEMSGDHLVFVKEKKVTCKINGNMVDSMEVERAMLAYAGIMATHLTFKDDLLSADVEQTSIAGAFQRV